MPRTVLLTGATGLLGHQILKQLLTTELIIFATFRDKNLINLKSENLQWIKIDNLEENLFKKITHPINYVIHAAALVSYQKADQANLFRINFQWTTRLANQALEEKVEKFIFISSIAALGKGKKDFINEETPFNKDDFNSNYGLSKRKAEIELKELANIGLPLIIFNPSVILGPAPKNQSSASLFHYVLDEKPFYTEGIINYIDARDVSKIIVQSLNLKIKTSQFILNTGNCTYRNFFSLIASALNKKRPYVKVPKFLVLSGAILELLYSKLRGKKPTLSMETAKMAGNRNIYDNSKAKSVFGLSEYSLEESINWVAKEMKK